MATVGMKNRAVDSIARGFDVFERNHAH
jgi:hypothetical protein